MNKIGKYLIIIGTILILGAMILVVRNIILKNKAINSNNLVLEVINRKEIEDIEIDSKIEEMRSEEVDGYSYIGIIKMPSIEIELPVMETASYDSLNIAPGRYYGSIYTNDLVICAHDYQYHFGRINRLRQGDRIIFTDILGNDYEYEVEVIEYLEPTDVKEMVDSEFDLTLYTCTYGAIRRVVVRCNRI